MSPERRAALESELEDWLTLSEDNLTEYMGGEISGEEYHSMDEKCEANIEDLRRLLEF